MQPQDHMSKPQGQNAPSNPMAHGGAPTQNSEPEALRNLMVNYIPTTIDEMQLRQLFEMYGPIESIKIVCDRETRQSRGYGFVKYRFAFSAVHAIQYLNGYPLMNKRLKVAYANAAEAQKASTGGVQLQQQQQQGGEMNPYQAAYQQQQQQQQPTAPQPDHGGGDQQHPGNQQQALAFIQQQQALAIQMMQYQQMMQQGHHLSHQQPGQKH